MKKSKSTTSQDWLDMDLKSQSGSIWTDEKTKMQKEKKVKKYKNPDFPPQILRPDPVEYEPIKY